MKLTKEIAGDITEKMMGYIPHNINIMDERGIIIASGDKTRIGTSHMGAVEAIKKGAMVSVVDYSRGIRPGVNMPILFQDKIIGVIGITRIVEVVQPFALLVKGSAELLVNQQYIFQEKRVQERLKEEFLFQWIYRREAYDHEFISQGKDLGIDITKPRKVLFTEGMPKSKLGLRYLGEPEYIVSLGQSTNVILLIDSPDILDRAGKIVKNLPVKSAIGNSTCLIRQSLREGRKAITIAHKLGMKESIIEFSKVAYVDKIMQIQEDTQLLDVFYTLEKTEKGQDLISTLGSYIFNDGEISKVANELYIHRNSLGYRLSKIQEITGLNPKNYKDLYQLMTAFIQYKMKEK